MSDLAIGTAIGLAVGLLGGIPLALLGQRYLFGLLRERKVLGYEILAADVIIPKLTQPNPAATVMVRRSALEGGPRDPKEADQLVAVDEVYGFRVRLRNCGNAVLDNQAVRLTFEEGTRVILANMESAPELGDERVDIAVTEGGRSVVATFPYLNPKATAVISVQTVYNSTPRCQMVAAGRALRSFDMGKRRATLWIVSLAVLAGLSLISGGVLLGVGTAGAAPGSMTAELQTAGMLVLQPGILLSAALASSWAVASFGRLAGSR